MAKKAKTGGQSFLQGAMVLGVSMVIVKIMGMVYKILLARVLDGVGNGIFNIAYELYTPLFMLATAGFPIAISRMVSESVVQGRYRDVRKLHRISIPIFICTGMVCFLLMLIGGNFYADLVESAESKLAIFMLSPMILFGCLMAIYRGYYEGLRNMVPTAVSEIIEASGKLLLGLSLAYLVSYFGTQEYQTSGTLFGQAIADEEAFYTQLMSYTVAAAILGIAIGAFCGFLYLLLRHKLKGDGIRRVQLVHAPPSRSAKSITRQLITTAFPIGLGAIIMSISGTIDSTLVQLRILDIMESQPDLLQSYFNFVDPSYFLPNADGNFKIQTFLFGSYGYSLTLMMLITAVTQVFGTSALPSITAAWTARNKKRIRRSIETVLRTTTLVTLPAGFGMSVLAWPITNLVYGNGNNSAEVQIASTVLQIMGISVIFIATSTPVCSMLQAVGRVDLPLKLLTIGMVIKIILNYTLVGIPSVNIQGAAVGSLVGYLFVLVMGIYFLCKETKVIPNFVTVFIKPLLATLLCAVTAILSYNLIVLAIPTKIATILAILLAVVIYVIALFLLRAITKDDMNMLPKGKKIVKTLEKHHLIR